MVSGKPARLVNACITSIGYPNSFDSFCAMLSKYEGKYITDLDVLIGINYQQSAYWSAAKWIKRGDIVLFYHTILGQNNIKKIISEAQKKILVRKNKKDVYRDEIIYRSADKEYSFSSARIIDTLERNLEYSKNYCGSIFACALAGSDSKSIEEFADINHYKCEVFVPVKRIHIFKHPIYRNEISDVLTIRRNTITPLYKTQFTVIRDRLSEKNILPPFLHNLECGSLKFKNVSENNWAEIIGDVNLQFDDESQLREYFVDQILNILKDRGSVIHRECKCFKGTLNSGIVDYFIQINGKWLPVEAKMRLSKEKNIFAQIAKYQNVDYFLPLWDNKNFKFIHTKDQNHSLCMIVDQSGVFLAKNSQFLKCAVGRPILSRQEIGITALGKLKDLLKEHL